jgi:hypothetical protein
MATPPPARAPRPFWGRLLIGCAIVGGLLIMAGVAAFVFGMYWLTSPGRQYPTAAVASPESQGVVRVGDLAGDPGARALMTALFRRMQEASQAEGPQLPSWLRNLQAQQARQGISQWLPREATASLEPDAEGTPRLILAANMRGFVRPIRLALEQAAKNDRKASVTHHGDHEILNTGTETAMCFMDGTLVVSYHPDSMGAALDRLGSATTTATAPSDRVVPGKWDLHGWLSGSPAAGLLASALALEEDETASGEAALEAMREVRFGIDLESEHAARITTDVVFASGEAAAAAQPWLAEALARRRQRLESAGLQSTVTDSLAGDRVRYEISLNGIDAAIGRAIEEQGRKRRERTIP